jgi:hypothetical protein
MLLNVQDNRCWTATAVVQAKLEVYMPSNTALTRREE